MVNQVRRGILCAAGVYGVGSICPAWAQLTIEMSGAGSNRFPVTIAPFVGDAVGINSIAGIVMADLERCGLFRLVEGGVQAQAVESVSADLARWRTKGANAIVAANITNQGERRQLVFRLFDTLTSKSLAGFSYTFNADQARTIGHRIADVVYEKLLGERGYFSTRIAYVLKQDGLYSLNVSDVDGQNIQTWVRSKDPLLSPAWSPNGRRLAFVSMEKQKPIIYILDEASQRRMVLANYKGSNSAPAWAPDGNRLAVVLTKDGGSQLYLINADGSNLKRLLQSSMIDTEPTFSPDGKTIYFTSDRGGAPQIYRVSVNGGDVQRVTFEGGYNVSPKISSDGKTLAYVSRQNGKFMVCVMDLASQQRLVLSDTGNDESPSFSPNGRMILYATTQGGRDVLAAVSLDGRIKQKLVTVGDVREPTWGPFIN